jgi:uncharacterized membrane protein (GlpM family)
MMKELALRFLIGGVIVSLFAVVGEILRPKSFAGLFGAAPSIALATLGITIAEHGKAYAAMESRSMIFGSIGFFCYASATSWVLMRFRLHALAATITLLPIWLGASLGLWLLASR